MAKPTEGIPSFGKVTTYRGVTFKSQCEARWAALFDILKLEWEYEPLGEGTFPDFRCEGFYLEVKGGINSAHILSWETEKYEGHWADHPDAIKARQSASTFKDPVFIGTSDGNIWVQNEDVDVKIAESWYSTTLMSQSKYDWDRTLVMVTGHQKY